MVCVRSIASFLAAICLSAGGCADNEPISAAPLVSGGPSNSAGPDHLAIAAEPAIEAAPSTPVPQSIQKQGGSGVLAQAAVQAGQTVQATPRARGEVEGWIKDYVTQTISVLDASGRVTERMSRAQLPIPVGGLPFYRSQNKSLILVESGGRDLLLDSSEFHVQMAKSQVETTCDELGVRGKSPGAKSPASMGHAGC